MSFIDKDHMKMRYQRAVIKEKFPDAKEPSEEEPGFLEYFLVTYGV